MLGREVAVDNIDTHHDLQEVFFWKIHLDRKHPQFRLPFPTDTAISNNHSGSLRQQESTAIK